MKCELCDKDACFASVHWLKSRGIIVLYWCNEHALAEAEYYDDEGEEYDDLQGV